MMKKFFKYAVIRFRPFAETGEFANIGVVIIDLESGRIDFELAPKRFSRVKNFFEDAAYKSFQNAVDALSVELGRITDFLPSWPGLGAVHVFDDFVRVRESSVVFSNVRTVHHDTELGELTSQLFARYVKREFFPENAEVRLTQDIRRELRREGLRGFKNVRIQDDLVPVSFPLAIRRHDLRAIKPLAFSQKSPLSIVDYGAHWRKRLSYLLDRKLVRDRNVLLAIEGPSTEAGDAINEAFNLATNDLRELPFQVVAGEINGHVNNAIIDFARDSEIASKNLWH